MSNPTELPDLDRLEALARGLSNIRDQIMQDRVVSVVDVEDLIDRLALARRAQPEGEAPQAEPDGWLYGLQFWERGNPRITDDVKRFGRAMFAHPPAAQHADSGALKAADERVDAIVTGLYHRFKGWSKRGFGADDVTWCEVKADVIALIAAQSQGAQAVQIVTCKGKGGEYELVGYSNGAGPKRGESIVVYRDVTKPDVFYHRAVDDFRERMEWLGTRAAQQAAAPGSLDLMNADEMAALRRFDETCQDGEGYDVPKTMMQRLAAIGVVRRTSGSYYETTEFGLRVLDQPAPSAPGTPEAPKGGA